MKIEITKRQAKRLWEQSMDFSPSWRDQTARFEVHDDKGAAFEGVTDEGWSFYWCSTSADAVLLEAWFASQGIAHRALWDLTYAMANIDLGEKSHPCWVILANVPIFAPDDYWKA